MFITDSRSLQLMNKCMNLQILILSKSSTLGIFNFYTRLMYMSIIFNITYIANYCFFVYISDFLRLYSKADPHSKRAIW